MRNQFVFTDELTKECIYALQNAKTKKAKIVVTFILVMYSISLALELMKGIYTNLFLGSLIIILCLLTLLMFYTNKQKMYRAIMRERKKNSGKAEVTATIEIGNKIRLISGKDVNEIEFHPNMYYLDDKNFIFIIPDKMSFIALKKDSFVTGSYEECIKLLSTKIRKR